jgi:hypothetical protein
MKCFDPQKLGFQCRSAVVKSTISSEEMRNDIPRLGETLHGHPYYVYDPDAVALMGCVCDDGWRELQIKNFFPTQEDVSDVRHTLAMRILTAVANGERSPGLKSVALHAIDG